MNETYFVRLCHWLRWIYVEFGICICSRHHPAVIDRCISAAGRDKVSVVLRTARLLFPSSSIRPVSCKQQQETALDYPFETFIFRPCGLRSGGVNCHITTVSLTRDVSTTPFSAVNSLICQCPRQKRVIHPHAYS